MQSNLEATLAQLIAIPSVTTTAAACHEIIEYVRSQIAPYGFSIISDTNRDTPWLLATATPDLEPPILLAAHLDVVPGEISMFTMQKQDGKLVGRGAYDMKFAAACYIELIKNHAEELKAQNIGFLFTTDEETGSTSIPLVLEMGLRPGIVFLPDGGDNWHIEEHAKGLFGIDLVAKGRTAHGSRPWEGDNALHRLMDVLTQLRQAFPHQHPDSPTLGVNELQGGTAVNQVADYAVARLDFRSFHKEDLNQFQKMIETLAKENDLELSYNASGDPLLFDKLLPQAAKFLHYLEKVTCEPAKFTKSYGGSDGRFFAQYDIPCIIVQPHGGGRHSPDEWLLADDLTPFYELIKQWVLTSDAESLNRPVTHASTLHKTII